MRERLLSVAAATLACLVLAGCAVETFTYTIDRYGTRTGRHVHVGCRDTYEVFDRPDAGTLLVVTSPLNEAIAGLCDGPAARLSTAERNRRAAAIFLEETTDRPQCTIASETPLSGNHVEFSYRCPPARSVRR